MAKKYSLMGLWDTKTMFHFSVVLFFLGGLATLSFYRNNNQEIECGKVKVVTDTTTTTTSTNTNKGTRVFDHQRKLIRITPPSLTKTCDLFSGRWVHDNKSHYPLYKEHECPYLHGDLACRTYGRKDSKYQQWRWQPHGCDFPRSISISH